MYDTVLMPELKSYTLSKAHYRLVVDKVYNGKRVVDTLEIVTGNGGDDCGYDFVVGQKYIVFSQNFRRKSFKRTRLIETSICSYTQLYSEEFERRILALKG